MNILTFNILIFRVLHNFVYILAYPINRIVYTEHPVLIYDSYLLDYIPRRMFSMIDWCAMMNCSIEYCVLINAHLLNIINNTIYIKNENWSGVRIIMLKSFKIALQL